jgi:uncharacterized damage-inducible protein DinB
MRPRSILVAAAISATAALPLRAQQAERAGLVGDFLRDVSEVQEKIMGLARAMPADKWDWRPGPGVRSVGEVFLHIAADNYFIPGTIGPAAPAETKITSEYKTAVAFETRKLSRDATIAELEKSWAFLRKALSETTDAKLAQKFPAFGPNATVQGAWVLAVTHVHEHLGQAIAYARMNGIVPPWSK